MINGEYKKMNELIQMLESKKTSEVRKAAILLQKNTVSEVEPFVLSALQKEIITNRSWETKSELIKAIGINKYKSALVIIEDLANRNEEYDLVTIHVGSALIRMKRTDLTDVKELLKRLSTMNYSLGYGMLDALGYDKMQPSNEAIKTIIRSSWDFGLNRKSGFVDPRYGLAAACAGWSKELARDFLHHCIITGDIPLKYIAENSLKGKYVKLR